MNFHDNFPKTTILLLTTHTTFLSLSLFLMHSLSYSFMLWFYFMQMLWLHKKCMMVTNFQLFRYVIGLWAILVAQFQHLRFKFSIYSFKVATFHVNACLFSMKSTLFYSSKIRFMFWGIFSTYLPSLEITPTNYLNLDYYHMILMATKMKIWLFPG